MRTSQKKSDERPLAVNSISQTGVPGKDTSRTLLPTRFLGFLPFILLTAPIAAMAQDNRSTNSSTDNPPARVARTSYLKGNVSFLRAGLDQWSQAVLNFPV